MKQSGEGRSIGFIGVGNLGQGMALNLLEHEWQVTVYDTQVERLTALADAGADIAAEPLDLARCGIICLAVPDDDAVTALLLGTEGLLPKLSADQHVIIHSTILPATAKNLAAECEAAGVGFLDAPVSGGAGRARTGDLTLMVGGSADVLEQVRPLLDDMASSVLHLGAPGSGSATKLANQLMMFAALAGTHEALRLTAAYGVPDNKVLEAVKSSTGDTWVARNWGFFDDVAADYNRLGTPVRQRPWSKDLWEVTMAARSAGVEVPFAALLAQLLPEVVEQHADATASEHPMKGNTDE
ncbi:MAG: 6-phosphogluconate dehydrogenase NAD-binding protein [Micrococcaceae bacterium]|nr:6-phosphogluconate dehydrogenase NAD-binding protein [Micrococcaceae bacterium]